MTDARRTTELLAKSTLFGSLDHAALAAIESQMHAKTFPTGQQIFARGDAGAGIYLVLEGRVRFSIDSAEGRSLAFSHACEGEIFGEIAALDGGKRTADAIALTKVRALTLPRPALMQLMLDNRLVALAVIAFVCKRLRDTTEQIEQVALLQIEVRVARFLLHTLAKSGPTPGPRVRLDLGMPQGELALLIGTTRQSVNIALTALEHLGAIRRIGTVIECDVDRLTGVADGG